MNIPLSWLAEYVKLPKSEKELTDKLTMIGHMLDKRTEVGKDVVIDLELRGNRSDLFSIIGIAREVSAAWNTPLTIPKTPSLPKTDHKSTLISVEAKDLVERFIGFRLSVVVKPSPKWLADKLALYGVPAINNVVDITNYVMIESGYPLHAFDYEKITGGTLIVRRAKSHEPYTTLQGSRILLTTEDVALCDQTAILSSVPVGGKDSGVTDATTEILLETAVYNQANVRRTSRRHGLRTEASNRLEKLLDPEQLPWVLARAYGLLTELAAAKAVTPVSDTYIKKRKAITMDLDFTDVMRLTGTVIAEKQAEDYLLRLGFEVKKGNPWTVIAPTFRTDIEQPADVVEEIIRLYGYDQIPVKTLSGQLPEPNTYPMVRLTEQVRDILVSLQTNEVITSPIIDNALIATYQQHGTFAPLVTLVNAPDVEKATLRPSLVPNLVSYARRSLGFRQERLALFEIGKTYKQNKKPKYTEETMLGILIGGKHARTAWDKQERLLTVHDLKGVIEGLMDTLGTVVRFAPDVRHPSMDPATQGTILTEKGARIGSYGTLHTAIEQTEGVPPLFVAELSLEAIQKAPKTGTQPYVIAPQYPPIIEDITFVVGAEVSFGDVLPQLRNVHKYIYSVELTDVYNENVTVRIIYVNPQNSLTNKDVRPIREKLINVAQEKFGLTVQTS